MIEQGREASSRALGASVRSARTRSGLLQEQLAAAAGIGTSTLRQIEAGRAHGPNLFAVLKVLAAVGEPLDALLDTYAACAREAGAAPPPLGCKATRSRPCQHGTPTTSADDQQAAP